MKIKVLNSQKKKEKKQPLLTKMHRLAKCIASSKY